MPSTGKTLSYEIDSEKQCFLINNGYIKSLNKEYNINIPNPFTMWISDAIELKIKIPTQILGKNIGYDLQSLVDTLNNNISAGLNIKGSNNNILINNNEVLIEKYCGWIVFTIKYQPSIEICNICKISYNLCFEDIKIKELYNKKIKENIKIYISLIINLTKDYIDINEAFPNDPNITLTISEFRNNCNIDDTTNLNFIYPTSEDEIVNGMSGTLNVYYFDDNNKSIINSTSNKEYIIIYNTTNIDNLGVYTIHNTSVLCNIDTITLLSGIEIYGILHNKGTIQHNGGIMNINYGGNIYNIGTINHLTNTSFGQITINNAGEIYNKGTINNNNITSTIASTINNTGTFTNNAIINNNNYGIINNNGGTFNTKLVDNNISSSLINNIVANTSYGSLNTNLP